MLYNDVVFDLIYREEKRKLDQVTRKGWQFIKQGINDAHLPSTPCCKLPVVQVQNPSCATC
ncbi:MAG: hypothetical protein K0R47_2759 [Brevibacillus sp.]|nr:hypothetical protein [Brevibacillus sp.]